MTASKLTVEIHTLSVQGAKLALAAAEAAAAQKHLNASIAIVDSAGNLMAFQRADGAAVSTIEAALRKARTAAHLRAPTKIFEDLLHGGMTSLLAFEFISPSQGGVPLIVNGEVVGGIGTSGGSGEDDEAISNAGAAVFGS
jgi:glc operon protein GlcG